MKDLDDPAPDFLPLSIKEHLHGAGFDPGRILSENLEYLVGRGMHIIHDLRILPATIRPETLHVIGGWDLQGAYEVVVRHQPLNEYANAVRRHTSRPRLFARPSGMMCTACDVLLTQPHDQEYLVVLLDRKNYDWHTP